MTEAEKKTAPPPILSRETLMPLGLVVAIGGSLLVGGWTAASAFAELTHSVDANAQALEELRREIRESTGNRWTRRDMALWTALLKAQNPAIKVPPLPE